MYHRIAVEGGWKTKKKEHKVKWINWNATREPERSCFWLLIKKYKTNHNDKEKGGRERKQMRNTKWGVGWTTQKGRKKQHEEGAKPSSSRVLHINTNEEEATTRRKKMESKKNEESEETESKKLRQIASVLEKK